MFGFFVSVTVELKNWAVFLISVKVWVIRWLLLYSQFYSNYRKHKQMYFL